MVSDLNLSITDAAQWQSEVMSMVRVMGSPEAGSVCLTVPTFELRTRIRNLLRYTGFEHVFVTVSYLNAVPPVP